MAVFPIEDDTCEKKASDFLWETLYKNYLTGHVANVLYIGSKILSLIGQQILYADDDF